MFEKPLFNAAFKPAKNDAQAKTASSAGFSANAGAAFAAARVTSARQSFNAVS